VIYSYNKGQQEALFLNYFAKELYMFQTDLLSIIRVLIQHSQHLVFVILVMLPVCWRGPDLTSRQSI